MAKFLDKAGLERLTEHLDTKLSAKQDKLTGTPGQVVGFGEDGIPTAQDALTMEDVNDAIDDALADLPGGTPDGGGIGKSMAGLTVEPSEGETVTAGEGAEIFNDYRERQFGTDDDSELVVPKQGNVASGVRSHAEGAATTASGTNSHAEGAGTLASGSASHAEGGFVTGKMGCQATAYAAHAEGISTTASGKYSHAEGLGTIASGSRSHAEGNNTTASGDFGAHAEGSASVASGNASHAEGGSVASGDAAHAEGNKTTASGDYSHAGGEATVAEYLAESTIGRYNIKKNVTAQTIGDLFVIGKGTSNTARANMFRVDRTAVYGTGSYKTSGADYAELFEWLDGNPEGEDRVGRFVTLDGEKIRLAGPEDAFILGIVSGSPSVVGDVYDDQWQGMYLYDIYGRSLWEDVEVPEETIEEPDPEDPEKTVTRVITSARTEHRQKLNPDYDHTRCYIPRSERPEWDAVGMLGKLVVVDDGTCQVNGWCRPGEGGIAAASTERTRYRVMARLDDTHVRVLIM